MSENQSAIREAMQAWLKTAKMPCLPEWDALPEFALYMDQVILLLNQYLYQDEDERALTPAMINNYIKSRIIPSTIRKKYYRYHLAGLMIICILKESISIGDIPRLLPHLDTEEGIREAYETFRSIYGSTSKDFMTFVDSASKECLAPENDHPECFVLRLAVAANLSQTMANRMISLTSQPCQAENKKPKD